MPSPAAMSTAARARSGLSASMRWSIWMQTSSLGSCATTSRCKRQTESGPPLKAMMMRPLPGRLPGSMLSLAGMYSGFGQGAHAHQALIALVEQLIGIKLFQLVELGRDGFTNAHRHFMRRSVGATGRLLNDFVNEPVGLELGCSQPHGAGSLGGLVGAFPQNGCAAFG